MRHKVEGRDSVEGLGVGHERFIARVATATVTDAAAQMQDDWRAQIRAAQLGDKLANSVRRQTYPASGDSVDAAALVWTKAPKIIEAYARGATIRPTNGRRFLWLPTDKTPKKRQGHALTPEEVQARFGRDLDVVFPGSPSLRHTTTRLRGGVGFAGYYNLAPHRATGRWRNATRNEIMGTKNRPQKAVTRQFVVMFLLVPLAMVKRRGALDLDQLQASVDAGYQALMNKNWSR